MRKCKRLLDARKRLLPIFLLVVERNVRRYVEEVVETAAERDPQVDAVWAQRIRRVAGGEPQGDHTEAIAADTDLQMRLPRDGTTLRIRRDRISR